MMTMQLIILFVVLALFSLSSAILEPCIGDFECEKDNLKCTNLEYVGQPEQYDYSLPSAFGFVCLPVDGDNQ